MELVKLQDLKLEDIKFYETRLNKMRSDASQEEARRLKNFKEFSKECLNQFHEEEQQFANEIAALRKRFPTCVITGWDQCGQEGDGSEEPYLEYRPRNYTPASYDEAYETWLTRIRELFHLCNEVKVNYIKAVDFSGIYKTTYVYVRPSDVYVSKDVFYVEFRNAFAEKEVGTATRSWTFEPQYNNTLPKVDSASRLGYAIAKNKEEVSEWLSCHFKCGDKIRYRGITNSSALMNTPEKGAHYTYVSSSEDNAPIYMIHHGPEGSGFYAKKLEDPKFLKQFKDRFGSAWWTKTIELTVFEFQDPRMF